MDNKVNKVKIMFDPTRYNQKPSEIGKAGYVQNCLKAAEISVEDLAEGMSHGCTFKPCYLKGKGSDSFISSELIALDFDHSATIDGALKRCRELNLFPVFGYTSFNHSSCEDRFRLVFRLDTVITDKQLRERLQLIMQGLFPTCDQVCKDVARLFYGGRSLIYKGYDNKISVDMLLNNYSFLLDETKAEKVNNNKSDNKNKTTAKKANNVDDNKEHRAKLIEAISKLDVKTMRDLLGKNNIYGSKSIDKLTVEEKKTDINFTKLAASLKPKSNEQHLIDLVNGLELIFKEEKSIDECTSEEKRIAVNTITMVETAASFLALSDITEEDKHFCQAVITIAYVVINDYINKRYNMDMKAYSQTHPQTEETKTYISSGTTFTSKNEMYEFLNHIDMHELLGIGDKHVCCILPEHNDDNPSAHIYTNKNGVQFYKCFGCNKSRHPIGIVEHLAKCSRNDAIKFLMNVYGVDYVESDWVKEWKEAYIDYANYLDTDELKEQNPYLYNSIRTRKSDLKAILLYGASLINENMQIDGKPFFFASYSKLKDVIGTKKDKKISTDLALFAMTNLLLKLPIHKIPAEMFKAATEISKKYGYKRICNYFTVEPYGLNSLEEAENRAKILKENGVTLRGMSQEMVIRFFGEEKANEIYPQYIEEHKAGTTERSDKYVYEIISSIEDLISRYGYATVDDIAWQLRESHTRESVKTQIKKCLKELLVAYSLDYVKANKELKEKYNIKVGENSFPYVFIPKNDEEKE